MNSKSKLLDMTSEVCSSGKFEKPEGESVQRNKRSGEIDLQFPGLEEPLQGLGMKRKKKMMSSNVSYFGPLAWGLMSFNYSRAEDLLFMKQWNEIYFMV